MIWNLFVVGSWVVGVAIVTWLFRVLFQLNKELDRLRKAEAARRAKPPLQLPLLPPGYVWEFSKATGSGKGQLYQRVSILESATGKAKDSLEYFCPWDGTENQVEQQEESVKAAIQLVGPFGADGWAHPGGLVT